MLLTKIHIPSPGTNLVHRPILFDKLSEGLNRKLILVSAPAGFGKSTLISDWINRNRIPTAWYSIDNNDNDVVDFLNYVISALNGIEEGFGQSALNLLKSPNQTNSESIVNLLINDIISIRKDFLLVLDDFHLIDNKNIFNLVSYFLDHIPDNIHIVISTRSDPNISIARIRSQNQLIEIRSSDLSFSAYEISVLFKKKFGFKLSKDDILRLEAKTEGWIAGLQLTALSMHGRENVSEFILDLKGDNRYIMDYLIEEVLKIQSDITKEFLLQTSILKQFSAPLCNAVLSRNDSQDILDKLERSNMFILPLDKERKWYRYHHLFAFLLSQRLLQNEKSTVEGIHNKACEWFEENGMFDIAIEHAIAIKKYSKSIQLLDGIIENMWENGLHDAILKYGDIIPDEFIKESATFCLYYSWIMISAGEIHKAEPFLLSAEKSTKKLIHAENSSKETVQYNKKFLGKISVAFAALNSHENLSGKTLACGKTAMEYLSEDDPLWLGWTWYFIGTEEFAQGNYLEGIKAVNSALEYSKKSGNFYLMSGTTSLLASHKMGLGHYKSAYNQCTDLLAFMKRSGYSQIAEAEWSFAGLFLVRSIVLCAWADFDEALEDAKIAYHLCKDGKDIYQKIATIIVYSYILYLHEDKTGADDKFSEADDNMKQYKSSPFIVTIYIGWKIYLLVESNKLDEANEFAKENGLGINNKISYENENSYIYYTRLLLANYKLDDAALVLSDLYALATAGKRVETLVQLKILSAMISKTAGKQAEAVADMIEAMELAAEENLLVHFLLDIDFTNDLLKEAYKIQATKKTKIPKQFIEKLKLAIENKGKIKKVHAEGELSNRELDTLKLIAENLSNQEIADNLFISLNTVKTHVKNILLKLEADNRLRAVAKAKEQGIL
jgi:LuxR family maltose regulon positive regulatory protein